MSPADTERTGTEEAEGSEINRKRRNGDERSGNERGSCGWRLAKPAVTQTKDAAEKHNG
jgi:hypothetical protein